MYAGKIRAANHIMTHYLTSGAGHTLQYILDQLPPSRHSEAVSILRDLLDSHKLTMHNGIISKAIEE